MRPTVLKQPCGCRSLPSSGTEVRAQGALLRGGYLFAFLSAASLMTSSATFCGHGA